MNPIQNALIKLDGAIAKLEGSLLHFEEARVLERQGQRDMFSGDSQAKGESTGSDDKNVVVLNRDDVRKRLDQAIKKVEHILKEAS